MGSPVVAWHPAALPLCLWLAPTWSQSQGGLGPEGNNDTERGYPRAIYLQGVLVHSGSLHESYFWNLVLGLGRRNNRSGCLIPTNGTILGHHTPKPYLEKSKSLGRPGVVPVVVLKTPERGDKNTVRTNTQA